MHTTVPSDTRLSAANDGMNYLSKRQTDRQTTQTDRQTDRQHKQTDRQTRQNDLSKLTN